MSEDRPKCDFDKGGAAWRVAQQPPRGLYMNACDLHLIPALVELQERTVPNVALLVTPLVVI